MKGPGLRAKLETRRLWKCPQTGKTLRTPGRVTQLVSPFARPACFMTFVEEIPPARVQPPLEEILSHMLIEPEPAPPVAGNEAVAEEKPAENTATDAETPAP